MSFSLRALRRRLMGVSDRQATAFSPGDTTTWRHLESAVLAAVGGYHAVLDRSDLADLVPRLDTVALELRGYAYEGAAMGLTGLDCVLPGRSRLDAYLAGPGAPHVYMAHIGAGEALARLRRRPEPFIAKLQDRVLCWLAMDGYGFHEGFFAASGTWIATSSPGTSRRTGPGYSTRDSDGVSGSRQERRCRASRR